MQKQGGVQFACAIASSHQDFYGELQGRLGDEAGSLVREG